MSHSLASYSPKQLLKADLVLVVVTLLAAAGWIFSKETLLGLPPLLFMGLRFLCGGALVALLAARHLARLNSEQWHSAVLVGLFMGAAMGIWIFGLHTTKSLGEGAFITSLSVVVVPMVNWLLFKQRPTRVTFIALPIAIIGMALLSLRHGFTPDPSQWYFFVAAMLLSVAFILNSRAAAKTPALALSAIQLLLVGAVTFCSSLLLESWPNFLDLPAAIWGWLFLSFTLATAGRFTLQTYAQGISSPEHAAVIMILEPVWTALFAAFWFAERMEATQILGCGFILLALLIHRLKIFQKLN